jgi:hypothetical protein
MNNQLDFNSLIESTVSGFPDGKRQDARRFFQQMVSMLPVQPGQVKKPSSATAAASGANGSISLHLTNPSDGPNSPIYHEVSYSTVKNFSQNVTVLPVSTATGYTIPAPGQKLFVRVRSSYDGSTWNSHQLVQNSAVDAGLQSSAASANNLPLNQTNFATVDSISNGTAAAIRVYGSAGPYHGYARLVGVRQVARPSATIINAAYGSTAIIAYDGEKFRTSPILGGVFDDSWEPVGSASVIDSGVPTLPTVALVLGAGGAVTGWNVTSQGNQLTGPVTLTINTTTGSGATAGPQTIQNGKLISIAPGNPGQLYANTDTVSVSGGVGGGATGGGGAAGGNNARLVNF